MGSGITESLWMTRKLGYFYSGRARLSPTSRERISVMYQKHWKHNETNGYSRRNLFRGLARSGIKGGDLQWCMTRTGVLDLEATGGAVGRTVDHHGTPTPLLPLERQILQEAEAITPPRGGGASGSRASATPRRDTSRASYFYGRPDKGRQFGPTE